MNHPHDIQNHFNTVCIDGKQKKQCKYCDKSFCKKVNTLLIHIAHGCSNAHENLKLKYAREISIRKSKRSQKRGFQSFNESVSSRKRQKRIEGKSMTKVHLDLSRDSPNGNLNGNVNSDDDYNDNYFKLNMDRKNNPNFRSFSSSTSTGHSSVHSSNSSRSSSQRKINDVFHLAMSRSEKTKFKQSFADWILTDGLSAKMVNSYRLRNLFRMFDKDLKFPDRHYVLDSHLKRLHGSIAKKVEKVCACIYIYFDFRSLREKK